MLQPNLRPLEGSITFPSHVSVAYAKFLSRLITFVAVAFDVHIAEIMVALAVGIPILAAPRSLLLEDLPYYIKHLRVSHVGIVPSLIEATMGAVQADDESGAATTLRYIASGGEKMSDAVCIIRFHYRCILKTPV